MVLNLVAIQINHWKAKIVVAPNQLTKITGSVLTFQQFLLLSENGQIFQLADFGYSDADDLLGAQASRLHADGTSAIQWDSFLAVTISSLPPQSFDLVTVSLSIAAVNDALVAVSASVTGLEDTPYIFSSKIGVSSNIQTIPLCFITTPASHFKHRT